MRLAAPQKYTRHVKHGLQYWYDYELHEQSERWVKRHLTRRGSSKHDETVDCQDGGQLQHEVEEPKVNCVCRGSGVLEGQGCHYNGIDDVVTQGHPKAVHRLSCFW